MASSAKTVDWSRKTPIKYGVIGTNWITETWIKAGLPNVAEYPWRLTAVYSRDQSKAQAFADKHGAADSGSAAAAVYTSIEALANDKDIQAVYIASPNSLHYEQAKICLNAKKHVVIEKPATSTLAELRDLYATADKNNVLLLEAYRQIWEPNFLGALQTGISELGTIYAANLRYENYSSRYANVLAGDNPPPNIFSLEYSGGALVDVGVYPIAFAVALWGKPKSVRYNPFICPTGADGGGFGVLQYEHFPVQITCSKAWTANDQACEIYGENGKLVLNGVADIGSVKLHKRAAGSTRELSAEQIHPSLNLVDEARVLGRIVSQFEQSGGKSLNEDGADFNRLKQISLTVLEITEEMRRQGGVVFAAERSRIA